MPLGKGIAGAGEEGGRSLVIVVHQPPVTLGGAYEEGADEEEADEEGVDEGEVGVEHGSAEPWDVYEDDGYRVAWLVSVGQSR